MTTETLNFRITVSVKDKESEQIKKLTKQLDLKIDWKVDWRGERGFLNPKWEKYIKVNGKHDPSLDGWKSGGEIIQFEEDGKKYDILVQFNVKRGWFSDKVEVKGFEPSSRSASFVTSNISDSRERERMEYAIIPTYQRKEGPIVVTLVIIVIVITILLLGWKKNKEK